jgi:hypothetical protein
MEPAAISPLLNLSPLDTDQEGRPMTSAAFGGLRISSSNFAAHKIAQALTLAPDTLAVDWRVVDCRARKLSPFETAGSTQYPKRARFLGRNR